MDEQMLGLGASKVPNVSALFWVAKVMATTVGETCADALNAAGLGLGYTTLLMFGIMVVLLVAQFAVSKYMPFVYWPLIVLVSVVGTLITDIGTDHYLIPLWYSSPFFLGLLIIVFSAWYRSEGTLSIHSIRTKKREAFYWATILTTFALGTAFGDLMGDVALGSFWQTLLLFLGAIGLTATAYYVLHLNEILAFWIVYVFTRPLGASLGDLLSQPKSAGGFEFGLWPVTGSFFVVIFSCCCVFRYQQIKKDRSDAETIESKAAVVPTIQVAPVGQESKEDAGDMAV